MYHFVPLKRDYISLTEILTIIYHVKMQAPFKLVGEEN